MKKILSLILTILVLFSLAGCGKNENSNSSINSSSQKPKSSNSSLSSSEVSSPSSSINSSSSSDVSEKNTTNSKVTSSNTTSTANGLDENYSNILLVNGSHPLPADYNYNGNLKTLEPKYLCGALNQIDKNIYDYLTKMIDDANAAGVNLKVLSPYRTYETQTRLFNNEVKKSGSEEAAATVVARPGTSEHHTGLAVDFNSVENSFEQTAMFRWLQENGANYGFILRYPKSKQTLTGVIYEPWHYRFVGIKAAKEINSLNMCLEEYIEYKNK